MRLIIFDIDGTLLRTSAVDDACFIRAAEDVLGFRDVTADWSQYEHCNDVAIVSQLVRERLGRACQETEMEAFRARFVQLLSEVHADDPSHFLPTPGAAVLLEHLAGAGDGACLATGGFERSARLKLRLASLDCGDLPAAFAEDGPSREAVVTTATQRAHVRHDLAAFDRAVSIGDGVWDVTTAAALGLPFIGIATGARAAQLHAAGAGCVLPDFADLDATLDAIATAPVPRTT